MLTGGTPRTIAPRGNVPTTNVQVNRDPPASRTTGAGHGEPVSYALSLK